MKRLSLARRCAPILVVASLTPALAQEPAPAPPPAPAGAEPSARAPSGVEEIIVTAQKREENINDIGMSIQAATGDQLAELGVTDPSQLDKVVTGFNYNVTYYGTPIYTIRGVGFQDTALASGPTVSIYIDEMPLPFSVMAAGATLDLQRVEALKGPQGTLFGQNSTGGAVNYIANKPSQEFEAGFEASYGRFNTTDVSGYLSGPITETLMYRFAGRVLHSGPWQKSFTRDEILEPDPYWTPGFVDPLFPGRSYSRDREHGDQEFYNMRGALLWQPSDRLGVLFTASGFLDRGDSQMPQLFGVATLNQVSGVNSLVANYSSAPHNPRAADWGPCVNVSGGFPSDVTDPNPFPNDTGAGEFNLANRLYDRCKTAERDNTFYSTTLRVDYQLTDDLTLTSLTSWGKFDRDARLESDGTLYQDYESAQIGYLKAAFQELRLSGTVMGEGNWVVGANYENTSTWDSFMQTYGISSAVPTFVPTVFPGCVGIPAGSFGFPGPNCIALDNITFAVSQFTSHPLGPTNPNNRQTTDTYAFFANLEYPVLDTVTVQGGVRYTNQKRDYRGCGSDGGDGTWADISVDIQRLLQTLGGFPLTAGVDAGPGNCASTGPPPTFEPVPAGFTDKLDEDNVSWRVGVNWSITPDILAYANVSQGYKSGSFPTVASAAFTQLFPAKQEDLLAYEVGGKAGLFDGRIQLNGAFFYYDYTDKQVLGAIDDPIFGSLPALVNVPESHVIGFEVSAALQPIEGLSIAPSVSFAKSEVDGFFRNFDPYFNGTLNASTKDFSGQPFPNVPKWQTNIDVQYERPIGEWIAFIGANLNYQSATHGFFVDKCDEGPTAIDPIKNIPVTCTDDFLQANPQNHGDRHLDIIARALLDVRAGVEHGSWRAYFWGRNVTNKWYWNQSQHVNDVLLRYTGMPATYGITVSYAYGK